jgi:hypothetical protein
MRTTPNPSERPDMQTGLGDMMAMAHETAPAIGRPSDFLGPDAVAGVAAALREARDDLTAHYPTGLGDTYIAEPLREIAPPTSDGERLAFPDLDEEEYRR